MRALKFEKNKYFRMQIFKGKCKNNRDFNTKTL